MQIAFEDGAPLRGDFVLRAVLRYDLTPVPVTLETTLRADNSVGDRLTCGKMLLAGQSGERFRIVKVERSVFTAQRTSEGEAMPSLTVVAFLDAAFGVAQPQPRAVIKDRASLGEIYRSCGASARVASDIHVERFACLKGHVPSPLIAQALQEEAAVPLWAGGRLRFVRMEDLFTGRAVDALQQDSTRSIDSPFREQQEIPYGWSVDDNGAAVIGRRDAPRRALYLPRTTDRVLNNLTKCLVARRVVDRGPYAGHLRAGDGIDIAGTRHVILTAAHAWEAGGGGASNQTTSLWLGQLHTR